jgi:hypothetical protein
VNADIDNAVSADSAEIAMSFKYRGTGNAVIARDRRERRKPRRQTPNEIPAAAKQRANHLSPLTNYQSPFTNH